jgi:magnesium chelatase accessory protein
MSTAIRQAAVNATRVGEALPVPQALPPTWPNREYSRTVATRRGKLHVQRAGRGPTALLIHGTGAATHTWRGLLPRLTRRFDVIAFDLPGHGWSEPSSTMTLDSLADASQALLSALDVVPAAIIGHSAGAAVALELALAARQKPAVFGINAALEPFGGGLARVFSPLARLAAATPLLPDIVCRRTRNAATVDRMLRSTGSRLTPSAVAEYQQVLSRPSHVRATIRMMAQWDLSALRSRIDGVADCTRLLACTGDLAVSVGQARRLCTRHPDLGLTVWTGPGHLVHEEQPARVAEWLLSNRVADR